MPLLYSGRYTGRRPPKVGMDYDNLNDAADDIADFVEAYLQETQKLIISKGVHLALRTR